MRFLAVTILFVVAAASFADGQRSRPERPLPKGAWEWNDADRLAERFNSDRMRERSEAYRATQEVRADSVTQRTITTDSARTITTDSAQRRSDRVTSYVIDGSRNPELFLPHELFDQLMTGLIPDQDLASKQRQFYGPAIRSFGLDEREFWDRIERVAGQYARTKYQHASAGLDANDANLCRARYEAVKAARQSFGYAQFDRLLYSVIAPTMRFSAATTASDPTTALIRAEGGCQ